MKEINIYIPCGFPLRMIKYAYKSNVFSTKNKFKAGDRFKTRKEVSSSVQKEKRGKSLQKNQNDRRPTPRVMFNTLQNKNE